MRGLRRDGPNRDQPRARDRLYVQLGRGYPNGWDGAPCTCAPAPDPLLVDYLKLLPPKGGSAASPVVVIVGASFGLAATLKILAALAVIWLVCWYVGRLLEEREHRVNMRRTLERGLARRHGRGRL